MKSPEVTEPPEGTRSPDASRPARATKQSAGLLLYRLDEQGVVSVLLGHPGGPFFARKDEGQWTVFKGLVAAGEGMFDTARREFLEETGLPADQVPREPDACLDLGEVKTRGGKRVRVWSFAGECDPDRLHSNTFELEWPPRSGRRAAFPEIDRYGLFPLAVARRKIHEAQRPVLDRLRERLGLPEDHGHEAPTDPPEDAR